MNTVRTSVPFENTPENAREILKNLGQNIDVVTGIFDDILLDVRGWSHYVDVLRDELTENHRQIHIVDFDFYDMNIFNRCERERNVLLVIQSWNCVHPMLKVLPVEWDHSIPFGVLYSTKPSDTVRQFLDAVKAVIKEVSDNLQ